MIKIYNSMTRQKEVFEPLVTGKVSMYVCGPTVYNYIHIGNARSSVAFDTIRKYLEYRGYEVNYVSNFTDVDDKIIKAAKEEGLTPQEIADKYIQAFKEDTAAINVSEATKHPRVMDHIQEIIDFVVDLIDKDMAYESQGDVYFRAERFEDYGKLSGQSLADLRVGASDRVSQEELDRKESPLDFALWKAVETADEIAWESPWDPGRPGWHIECSVMATQHLGDTIDIHGGGQDLTFPHHENEIAQSESHTGHVFANYWMHNGFVTLGEDNEKMSKSLGNFVLLRDLLAEVDPQVVRYLLASVHYRQPLKFDDNAIENASSNLARLKELMGQLNFRLEASVDQLDSDQSNLDLLQTHQADFIEAMDDDFNTANGLTEIFSLVRTINRYLSQDQVSRPVLEAMQTLMQDLLYIYGLEFGQEADLLDQDIQDLLDERQEARLNKDFQRADEIRDHLKSRGIILDDTPQGTHWKRVN